MAAHFREGGQRIVVEREVVVPLPAAHHFDRTCTAITGLAAHPDHDLLGEEDPDLLVVDELRMLLNLFDRRQTSPFVTRRVELEAVLLTELLVTLRPELRPRMEQREVDIKDHGLEHPSRIEIETERGTHRDVSLSLLPSGCPDSNWGPLRPERSALPGCATPRAGKG